jgi:transposase
MFLQCRWEKKSKIYMPKYDPIKMTLNASRGKSVTIIGGISPSWDNMEYVITEKTNIKCVKQFIKLIGEKICRASGAIMVHDGHKAHVSTRTINYANSFNISFLCVPPTCSEINPIEVSAWLIILTLSLLR